MIRGVFGAGLTSGSAGNNSGEEKEEGLSDGSARTPIGGSRSRDWDFFLGLWGI